MPATVVSGMDVTETDEALMLRYRDGDTEAFTVLYDRHKGALYRYFLRQCPTPAVTEELFQDVWMNLVRARERYTVQAKFTTYLFRLAHNRLIDYYRRQANGPITTGETGQTGQTWEDETEQTVEDLLLEPHHEPENQVYIRKQIARLLALIPELPAPQREAFLLREEAGMSLDEIAEATGVGREAAKSRLRYALARLRRGLRDTV